MLKCYLDNQEEVFSEITGAAFRVLGLSGEAAAEAVFADSGQIRRVNKAQRGIDRETDVLSFPMLNLSPVNYPPFTAKNYPTDYDPGLKAVFTGSIMLCREVAKKQAEEYGHSAGREERYLFVHGLLHLLGFDHENDGDKQLMRKYEEEILKEAEAGTFKSGFISVLGKPNVGKSSLINALVGEKVSIVSPKSQTTRDRQMGILTTERYQMILIDTPGVHAPKSELGRYMEKAVKTAALDADAIVIVLDATKRLAESDIEFIEKYLSQDNCPVYIAVNKTDSAGFGQTYPILEKLSFLTKPGEKRAAVKEIVPLSAKSGENVEKLKSFLESELPEGELYFPEDDLTDKSVRYQICEIVREKALLYLRDEIPHGVGVTVLTMEDGETLAKIEADIVLEKESHKQIVIGSKGAQLKTIGEAARADIEKMIGKKVFLKLFVKVRENWRNRSGILADIGYNKKNL